MNRTERVGAAVTLIAAGALVTEHMVVPPRSFVVGVPGRVKGPVTGNLHEQILEGTRVYIDYARAYQSGKMGHLL